MAEQERILYCVNKFPSISETFVVTQAASMAERGHRVAFFAKARGEIGPGGSGQQAQAMPWGVTYAPALPPPGLARIRPAWKALRKQPLALTRHALAPGVFGPRHALKLRRCIHTHAFRELCRVYRPTVVHVHFAYNADAALAMRLAGLLHSGFVVTLHGADIQDAPAYGPRLSAAADVLTVNSAYTQARARAAGWCMDRVAIVPMGTDTRHVRRPETVAADNKAATLLFVGRFVAFKGPDTAVNILAALRRRGIPCRLNMIGDGPLFASVQRHARDLGLSDAIDFMGALGWEAVLNAMAHATLLVLPGRTDASGRAENQGVVLQEAQAMELPVVVSHAGGVSEGFRDGQTGFLCSPGQVDSFADACERLITHPTLRMTMGRAGRAFVREAFDSRHLAVKWEAIYTEARHRAKVRA